MGSDILEFLGDLIVSKTLSNQNKEVYRLAARGIIYNGEKVLMIHSSFYNDCTFPGGGVESGEDILVALARECSEEAGVVIKNIRPFYKTMEKREIDEKSYMLHESHFFLCDVDKIVPQHLELYEVELGYKPIWISVDEAIECNTVKMNQLAETDYKGVLERELRILYALKETVFK